MTDAELLARTAWAEERSLGKDAMQAVINVIMNRVAAKKWWGQTIEEVCKKPYQFDCWSLTDPNYLKMLKVTVDDPQYAIAYQLATDACNGCLPDITNGATFYYNDYIAEPKYEMGHKPCAQFGSMILFNDID